MREISLNILDIAKNSVKAKSTKIIIDIETDTKKDILKVVIIDNGCGMSKEFLENIKDPYTTTRTTRNVGLGIPLLQEACSQTGGSLEISSVVGSGTVLSATFGYSSIDRMPLGDIGGTISTLIMGDSGIRFILNYVYDKKVFTFDTDIIKEEMDGVPIDELDVLNFIKDYINENILNLS